MIPSWCSRHASCTQTWTSFKADGRRRALGLSAGLALVEPLEVASGETFVADPQVTLLGLLAIPFLNLGLVEQGRECLQRGHIRARALRQPMTRLGRDLVQRAVRGAAWQRAARCGACR
jgi:hypothetical protein